VTSALISARTATRFTGKQKLIDAEGRVDRFNKKYGRTAETERSFFVFGKLDEVEARF